MSTILFNLHVNNQPVQIEMVGPIIKQQQLKSDAYGQTPSNRLLLSTDDMVACLYLDDTLSSRDMKQLVNKLTGKLPRFVNLSHPIMAIHLIQRAFGWPEDEHSRPNTILNCLPVEGWAAMASKPPVEANHPLLNQPPQTLWFQSYMSTGMPASVHYDSIAAVEQINDRVLIIVHPEGNSELLGLAVVWLRDSQMAAGLAAGLRLRRVKRVGRNEMVLDIFLYPKVALCRGTVHRENWELNWSIERGNDVHWYSAMTDHPDVIATQMAQWRAVR